MLGSNSSISYIVLCNYHSNTSCNHKDTNCEEKPKEPLGIVTEVATIIFFVAFTDFFPFISKITDPLYLPLKIRLSERRENLLSFPSVRILSKAGRTSLSVS